MSVGREYREQWGTPLNPGRLTDSITYQRKSVAGQNGFGEDIYSWVDVQTMRADVRNLSGRELQNAQQRWAEAQYQITQHYVTGLQRADRIAWWKDGAYRYLDVLDIADRIGTGRAQIIIAKEWVGVEPPPSPAAAVVFDAAPGNFDAMTGNFDTPGVPTV